MRDEKPSRRPTQEFKVQPAGDETVRPPFDPEEFARESESRLRIAHVAAPLIADDEVPPSSQSATRLTAAARETLPAPDAVPFRAMAMEDLEWFDLDGEAKALLERVNGVRTIARIAETVGMEPVLACGLFVRLAAENIIGFR